MGQCLSSQPMQVQQNDHEPLNYLNRVEALENHIKESQEVMQNLNTVILELAKQVQELNNQIENKKQQLDKQETEIQITTEKGQQQ